jgi:putative phosphoribosyl transferase
VLDLNREERDRMRGEVRLEILREVGHVFEEPGAPDRMADLACDWFVRDLAGGPTAGAAL